MCGPEPQVRWEEGHPALMVHLRSLLTRFPLLVPFMPTGSASVPVLEGGVPVSPGGTSSVALLLGALVSPHLESCYLGLGWWPAGAMGSRGQIPGTSVEFGCGAWWRGGYEEHGRCPGLGRRGTRQAQQAPREPGVSVPVPGARDSLGILGRAPETEGRGRQPGIPVPWTDALPRQDLVTRTGPPRGSLVTAHRQPADP